ncbi:glutathione S-transferase T3-like [Eutrema salsugineum]|uniref:glutathione S-transferase T3-like n=1 Tax=Eutrema salsugineum TaxID=72664 RepID=UPI000CED59D2|nr:glutathione S-transferase T3-like [Eutrema salsugineum]
MEKRVPAQCKSRWSKINEQLCKFVGCFEAASTQRSSGQNDNDILKFANQIYLNDHNTNFTLEHAWRELRHDPKWCPTSGNGQSKIRRKDYGSTQSCSSHFHGGDESILHPEGVKAAKAKRKRKPTDAAKGRREPVY